MHMTGRSSAANEGIAVSYSLTRGGLGACGPPAATQPEQGEQVLTTPMKCSYRRAPMTVKLPLGMTLRYSPKVCVAKVLRADGRPGPRHPRRVDPDPRHHPRHGGRPAHDRLLPAFHAFERYTVHVAQNSRLRYALPAPQGGTHGLRFDQPLPDTQLLSALVQPNQNSHRLEAVAELRHPGDRTPHRAGRCAGHRRGVPEAGLTDSRTRHPEFVNIR